MRAAEQKEAIVSLRLDEKTPDRKIRISFRRIFRGEKGEFRLAIAWRL